MPGGVFAEQKGPHCHWWPRLGLLEERQTQHHQRLALGTAQTISGSMLSVLGLCRVVFLKGKHGQRFRSPDTPTAWAKKRGSCSHSQDQVGSYVQHLMTGRGPQPQAQKPWQWTLQFSRVSGSSNVLHKQGWPWQVFCLPGTGITGTLPQAWWCWGWNPGLCACQSSTNSHSSSSVVSLSGSLLYIQPPHPPGNSAMTTHGSEPAADLFIPRSVKSRKREAAKPCEVERTQGRGARGHVCSPFVRDQIWCSTPWGETSLQPVWAALSFTWPVLAWELCVPGIVFGSGKQWSGCWWVALGVVWAPPPRTPVLGLRWREWVTQPWASPSHLWFLSEVLDNSLDHLFKNKLTYLSLFYSWP
jgi:hypothetical protein